MTAQTAIDVAPTGLFGTPDPADRFAGIADPSSPAGMAALRSIAGKIGRTRRPGAVSAIPAGATYLAQFAAHDLDFLTREGTADQSLLDLALIYGDGPRHDAFCYQVPAEAGATRHLLRVGRTRPTAGSPAWGASRDLPRTACPHLDGRAVESKTEVLVPNAFSDSNALLAQIQTLWALAHNAIAAVLAETRTPADAFEQARRINRGIYRDVLRHDVLGSWLIEPLRARYTADAPHRLTDARFGRAPREFMAGVGRLGHGLVREIYALNDTLPVMGLRNIMRQTATGRPHDMPLTEDWLLDFGRFFAIGASVPQRARAIGPHVARPFAAAAAFGSTLTDAAETLVLRDLVACADGSLRSVRSLIDQVRAADPTVLEGCFAQDEGRWTAALAGWLADTGLDATEIVALAGDPPLSLFLMLEAEADADGLTLGALGSVLMGETLTAGLPAAESDARLDAARAAVFHGRVPSRMSELIRFLQGHYKFADGARLHAVAAGEPAGSTTTRSKTGDITMLDSHMTATKAIPRIEVADFIEMGRLVAEWSIDPSTRPACVEDLAAQLDGIAVLPERIKHVEFVQSTLDTLVLRLPVREMIEESLEKMSDPMGDGRYPLPQFYADHYRPGFGPVMTPLDTLLARVGDYTIAQCR